MRLELFAVDSFDSSSRDEMAVEWLRAQAAEKKRREERLNHLSVAAVFVSGLASILSASYVASKYLLAVAPWFMCMGMLAIRPVEAQTIRRSIACKSYLYAAYTVLAAPLIRASFQAGNWIDVVLTVLKVMSALGTSVALQIEIFGYRQPRQQLQRLWLSLKLNCIVHGVSEILHHVWYSPSQYVGLVTGLSFMLLVACIGTADLRGAAIRALDAFLAPGSVVARREQAAAFISSLMDTQLDVVKAYTSAKERFRCVPVQSIHRNILAKMPDPPRPRAKGERESHNWPFDDGHDRLAIAAMMSATRPATFGQVDAFMSYAWHDCGDALYDALQAWASATRRRRGLSHTEELTVWLDRACLRGGSDITVLLTCLPIFLAGCKQLLVLAGPTFSSRLWCAMELFAFIRMGGTLADIDIRLIVGPGASHQEEASAIKGALSEFDAAKACCSLSRDRHRLLAVIETAYGTVEPFNELVRELFFAKLAPPPPSASVASFVASPQSSSYSPLSSRSGSPCSMSSGSHAESVSIATLSVASGQGAPSIRGGSTRGIRTAFPRDRTALSDPRGLDPSTLAERAMPNSR